MSEAFWKSAYGSDPRTLGAMIDLDGRQYQVIGILPEGFRFPSLVLGGLVGTEHLGPHALWVPVGHRGSDLGLDDAKNYELVGRLSEGAAASQVEVEAARTLGTAQVVSRVADETGDYARSLILLLGMSGVLLLAAGCDAASLFMAEKIRYGHEFGLRLALGAGSGRLYWQLASEGLLLGALESMVGVRS